MPADPLHPMLQRQLDRLGLRPEDCPDDASTWQTLLERVSKAYREGAQDRHLLKRSMQVVAEEMAELYAELELQAHSNVAAERNRLEDILAALTDGFVSIDPAGGLTRWNPAAEGILGALAVGEPVLRRMVFDPSTGIDPDDTSGLVDRLADEGRIHDDRVHLDGDGPRTLSVLLFPITANGEVSGVGVTFRDITTAVRDADTLRRLAMAVDASADAIYITNTDGEIEYVNAAFTTVTGWSADAIRGHNPRVLKSGRTDSSIHQEMWATLGRGEVWSGRVVNRRRITGADGSAEFEDYWAQSTIAPYFSTQDELLGYVALQRDVTESVHAERQQRLNALASRLRVDCGAALHGPTPLPDRLNEVLRLLSEGLSASSNVDFSAVLCIQQHGEGCEGVTAAFGSDSDRWRELVTSATGVEIEELSGVVRFGPDIGGPLPDDPRWGLLVEVMPESDVRGHLVLLADRQINRSDTLRDAVIAVSDMVGLTIAEERARRVADQARQAAEQAASAKSQFLANMSHEIRTPMNGVLGMLELLDHTDLDSRQRDYVDVARSSAETLLTIINDILDLSRIEAGKVDIEHVPIRIRDVVNSSTALFSGTASIQGVALFTEISDEVPAVVLGDPTRLRQVLTNLVGNAIKFTARGQVTVAVSVGHDDGRDTVTFEVIDTGIGIPATRLDQIFESFSQADSSTTRRFGGTGLGLAICRHLVELMSGTIWVTSVEQEGTTFAFSLPMPRAEEPRVATPTDVAPGAADTPAAAPTRLTGHVLLVEDNAVNRHVGAGMLNRLGIEVTMAEDGEQALAAIAQHGFDLVLMDCQMPVMDGFEATRALRTVERATGTSLPVVALTADAMAGAAEQCIAAGMDAYLAKPYTLDGLRSALEPWLNADVLSATPEPARQER